VGPRGRKFITDALLTNFVGSFGSRVFPCGGPDFLNRDRLGAWAFNLTTDTDVALRIDDGNDLHRHINRGGFRRENIFVQL
jgi:hypothetical protein